MKELRQDSSSVMVTLGHIYYDLGHAWRVTQGSITNSESLLWRDYFVAIQNSLVKPGRIPANLLRSIKHNFTYIYLHLALCVQRKDIVRS